MTTSGTTTGTMTAIEMIATAMEEIGVLSSGEVPTAEEGVSGMRRLTWMLKSWQARGCNLWRDAETTAVIPANTAALLLPNAPVDVFDVRIVGFGGIERLLNRWEAGDYATLPNKAAPGVPTIYTLIKAVDGTTLKVWPVPTIPTTVAYHYARVVEDVTDPTQTVDVPQQWTETVWMNLSARLANTFGATRVDPSSVDRVTKYAAALEQMMLDSDRPASVFMGPAIRGRYGRA